MDAIAWIIFGALVGWIASLLMNTGEKHETTSNILVGIVGAFIGGFVMLLFGMPIFGSEMGRGFNLASLLVSIMGAMLLIAILRTFHKGSAAHR